jgi:hypothetical protein
MAALLKARRVTAWSGVVSLGVGFVGAVMLERDMVPSVIGNVPMGPANVRLGELYATLQAEGHYAKWGTDGAGGVAFEPEPGGFDPGAVAVV